jgi:4-diphosphocytidyl-2-C-methyl-D-erythritol kinase
MVVFPNCKINIGLQVTGRRKDGFHDIETVFYPIALKDALEIIPSTGDTIFTHTGLAIPGSANENLCVKAYELVRQDFHLPAVRVHLHKAIPMGAGLGGGSADAAFMLKLINATFNLEIPDEKLLEYALKLGSDCPFFIINKPCFASGRGENLLELNIDLSRYKFLVVNPNIHINTGWAFSQITPAKRINRLEKIASLPVTEWQQHFTNDFELPVFEAHPEISKIKGKLADDGAVYVSMSGTGSTVYGIFDKDALPIVNFPDHYFYKWV